MTHIIWIKNNKLKSKNKKEEKNKIYIDGKVLIGKNKKEELFILPSMANRHGLITGASGP